MLGSYIHKNEELDGRIPPHSPSPRQLMNGHLPPQTVVAGAASSSPQHRPSINSTASYNKMRDINENVKEYSKKIETDLTCEEKMDISHSDLNDEQDLTCNESVANDSAEFEVHSTKSGHDRGRQYDSNSDLVIDLGSNVNQNNNKIEHTPAILRAVSLANTHSMIAMPTMMPPSMGMKEASPVITQPPVSNSTSLKLTKKGTVPVREAVDPAKYVRLQDVDGVRYACSKCGNVYKWRKSLNKHWKEKHDGEIPVPATGNFPVLNIPHLKGGPGQYSTPKSSTSGRTMISPSMLTPLGNISSSHLEKYIVDMGAQSGGRPIQSSQHHHLQHPHHQNTSSASSITANSYSSASRDMFSKTERFDAMFRGIDIPYSTPGHNAFFRGGMRLKTDISPAPLQTSQPRFPSFDKFPYDYSAKDKPVHVPVPPPAAHSHGPLKQPDLHDDDSSDSMPLDLSKKGKSSNALDLSAVQVSSGLNKPPGSSGDAPLDFSIKSTPGSERSTPVNSLKDRDEYMETNWMRATSTPESEVYQNLQCYKCPFVAKDKQTFEEHLEEHTRGQYPQCAQCKEHFSSNDELTRHFGLHHLHILTNIEHHDEDPAPEQKQLFQYLTKTRDGKRKCVVCGATFPHHHDIARHFSHFHADLPNPYRKRANEDEDDENEPWPKVAKFDNKAFGQNEGDLECEQCAFIARDPAEMSRHLLVHSFNRPHACTMCGFSSKSKDELSAHIWKYHPNHAEELALMATNGGATPVSASKNFNMNTDKSPTGNNAADTSGSSVNSGEFGLDDVIIVTPNTTEVPLVRGRKSGKSGTTSSAEILLPYKCSVCEYRARWPSEITQHMKNHSDEKPFHCPRCTYKSKWKWDVVKHLKRCGGGTVKDVIDTSRVHRKSEGDSNSPPSQNVVKQLQFLNSSPKHSMLSNGPPNVTVLPGSSPRVSAGMDSNLIGSVVYSPTTVDNGCHMRGAPSPANSTSSDHSSIRNPSSPGGPGKSRPGFNRGLVNQGIYHCTQCPFIGNSPAELKRHCRVHSDEKPFSCATCGYSSKWKCDLKKHIKTYEHVAAPRCDGLEMKQKRDSLRFISSTMEGDDLSSCSEDESSYLDQHALSPEELPTPRPTLYKCDKCQYVTYKKNMLDGHMKIHRQSKEKGGGKLKCKQCDYEATDLSSFLQHKKTHSSQSNPDVSEDNNNGKSSEYLLNRSRSEKDGSPVRNRRKPMKYITCAKCPYICMKYAKLEIHELMHEPHDHDTSQCEFCDYNVQNKALLIQHMKMHPEFDEWHNQNGMTLNNDLLQKAELLDLDEAEYIESKYGSGSEPVLDFSNKTAGLNLTVKKPSNDDLGFRCNKCSFVSDSGLDFDRHMQHHGLGENFECEHCDWSAEKLHLLYKHVREVHPLHLSFKDNPDSCNTSSEDAVENRTESSRTARKKQRKPRTCGECGYMTDNQVKMTQHMDKHETTNQDAPSCHYCEATFRSLLDMHEHLLHQHNVKIDSDALMSKRTRHEYSEQQDGVMSSVFFKDGIIDCTDQDPSTKQLIEIKSQKIYVLQYSNRKVFACTKCSYRTNNSTHCVNHTQQHGSGKRYMCEYCDYSLDKLTHIFHHMKMCHAIEMDSSDTEAEGPSTGGSKTMVNNNETQNNRHSPQALVKNSNNGSLKNNQGKNQENRSISLIVANINRKSRKDTPIKSYRRGHSAGLSSSMRCKSNLRKQRRFLHKCFRCKICSYSATRQFLIRQHMQFHDNLTKTREPMMMMSNRNKIGVVGGDSVYNHHEAKHKCSECPFSSNKLHELKKHKALHVTPQKYSCEYCSYSVNRMNILQQHQKLHSAEEENSNDRNVQRTGTNNFLLQSKYKILLQPIVVKHAGSSGGKLYRCAECPYAGDNKDSYVSHTKHHGGDGRYPCNSCNYVADRPNHIYTHRQLHTEDQTSTSTAATASVFNMDRFKCAKCPYHTHSERILQVHYQMHSSELKTKEEESNCQYKCERCPYQTNINKNFESHLTRHSVHSKFMCAYCDYSSQKVASLTYHIRLHLPGRQELNTSTVKAIIASRQPSNTNTAEDGDEIHNKEESLIKIVSINNNNKNTVDVTVCKYCARNFSSETEKKIHERQHILTGSESLGSF